MAVRFSDYFFWLKWVDRIILGSFWWVVLMLLVLWVPFLRVWWWVFLPLFLSVESKRLYLWWINWDYYYASMKWVVLEIVPPKETMVPLKAMEDVFTVLWPNLYSPPSWREKWCEGMLDYTAMWMSFEIASIEGKIHFYMRVNSDLRSSVESALYGHYPDLEINEVPDYTKPVPKNIPNDEWNVYGEDFILGKANAYPIKTYEKFFEPQGERIAAEEKRIDPIASLIESLSKLGPGEQFWVQFTIASIGDEDSSWRREAEKIVNKIAKRPEKKTMTLADELLRVISDLIMGPQKEGSGEKATYKWIEPAVSEGGEREMLMTSGEREIVTEIENKLKKPVFRTSIRGMYVAKRENWKSAHRIITRSYFAHFQTQNLNYVRFSLVTRPKTQYMFRKRIPFIRVRRMFRNYVLRFPPLFPNRRGECPILNAEELATLMHFPVKITGMAMPSMTRVESRKGGPPPNLPTE